MYLHTTTIGEGRRPVVFLHGLFGQGKNFTSIARALQSEVTSVLVDLPNHGRSPWTSRFGYDLMADDLLQTIRTVTRQHPYPGGVVLLGHSMGGKVAMRFALEHPELVMGLLVVDISPGLSANVSTGFGDLVKPMRELDLKRLTSRGQADELLAPAIPDPVVRGFLLQNLHFDHGRASHPTLHRHWRWQVNLQLLGDNLATLADWPDPGPARYDGPVMWVAGEHSDYVTEAAEPTMRRLFPHTRKIIVKHAGHWVHADAPETFVGVLRCFLSLLD